jgi:hypothetical protein
MGVVSRALEALASSAVAVVAGAEVAPVAVVGVEGMKTFVGKMASVQVVDGSVGSRECLRRPMGRR